MNRYGEAVMGTSPQDQGSAKAFNAISRAVSILQENVRNLSQAQSQQN